MTAAEDVRGFLDALEGEHRRSLGDRVGNWWGALFIGASGVLLVSMAEAALRGWPLLRWSLLSTLAAVVCGVAAAAYVRAFNRGVYRVGQGAIAFIAPWPVRGWRATRGEIASVRIERHHAWCARISMEDGTSKLVALTDSMATALGFAGRR